MKEWYACVVDVPRGLLPFKTSIATILRAPTCFAPITAANPTAPSPKTATVELGSTLQVFKTAPYPVDIPQPSRQTFSRGASFWILNKHVGNRLRPTHFAAEIADRTVYSLKVDVPMKWKSSFPLHVKRLDPSGITPCPCVTRIFWQRLVFGLVQKLHSRHWGTYTGMTWSPGENSVTSYKRMLDRDLFNITYLSNGLNDSGTFVA